MSGSGGSSGGGGPCGACKFLRRKCVAGCVFAPYFDSEQGAAQFAAVHKVFGASNVSKLIGGIPPHKRLDAVITICYEAQFRIRDPVYGCVSQIFALQQQVVSMQAELAYLRAQLAALETPPPAQPQMAGVHVPAQFSIADLATLPSNSPTAVDLSMLLDPMATAQTSWALHLQQQQDVGEGSSGGGELQALAMELVDRRRSSAGPSCSTAHSPPPPPSTEPGSSN